MHAIIYYHTSFRICGIIEPINIGHEKNECDPSDNIAALAQITAWHLLGVKPLNAPVFFKSFDAIWHRQATMS